MPKVHVSKVIAGGSVNLPIDLYQLRITKATFGISRAKGNPMTTLECEIIGRNGEPVIEIDGQQHQIQGLKVIYYLIYTQGEKGQIGRVFEFNRKLNIVDEEIDTDNPDISQYVGKKFEAIVSAQPQFALKRPEPGQKVGAPILDADGKPILRGYQLVSQVADVQREIV